MPSVPIFSNNRNLVSKRTQGRHDPPERQITKNPTSQYNRYRQPGFRIQKED